MKQQTLAMAADQDNGFEHSRKPTRREEFLRTMQTIVPWAALCQVIEPHYPKAGNGRPPIGLERMLRIHFLQHWFNLADEACEEALLDSTALRRFVERMTEMNHGRAFFTTPDTLGQYVLVDFLEHKRRMRRAL